MTTIVDPIGTPTIIYSRSGVTVQSVTATGFDRTNGLQLVSYSETSVFLVAVTSSDYAVMLPANCDIGDVVEVYRSSSGTVHVFGSGSDTINGDTSEHNGIALSFPQANRYGLGNDTITNTRPGWGETNYPTPAASTRLA